MAAKRSRGHAGQRAEWANPALRDPRYSQSLERGLAVLCCFNPKRPVLGIADMADHLGIHRSTTHRYVTTLLQLGYLEQTSSRKYRLGLRVNDLGMAAVDSHGLRQPAYALPAELRQLDLGATAWDSRGLRRPAHIYLAELRQQTTYAVGLGIIDATDVLYMDRVPSCRYGQSEINLSLHTGSRTPVYCTSMGKLLLANLPPSKQRELITQLTLTRHGPHTLTSKKALRAELAEIIVAGFAMDDQELAADRYAIASPVRNNGAVIVAAVNLAAPSSMISLAELVYAHGTQLTATAEKISSRLGYQPDDPQRAS
jgi:IclR family transcriptional regulator, pca regulon regulatory protein